MRLSVAIILVLLISISLAGCLGFEPQMADYPISEGEEGRYSTSEYLAPPPAPDLGLSKSTTSAMNAVVSDSPNDELTIDQKIIKTADLQIEVSNVTLAADDIGMIAISQKGMIQTSSVQVGRNNRYTARVTLRVPGNSFEGTLNEIRNLGRVLSEQVSAEDVTEEYVDLVAQQKSLSNQLNQYNRLLEKAVNVSEVLEVQKEIERVQLQLDRITGRMKYLDNRISFSTISISLSEPAQVETPVGYSIADVISDGIEGFTTTIVWLFISILTLLPIIILGGVIYFLYRRRKLNKAD